jgi:geranylgeranyl diphosphate synthase type II
MGSVGAIPMAVESPDPASPADLRALVEARLPQLIPAGEGKLAQAARDALLSPGKRVRPVLAMMAAEQVGGRAADALDFGCAVEMIHAASLTLDDLPCMDDAELRRGAPALHRRLGEDAAILAAVALLTEATRVVVAGALPAEARLELVDLLTGAVGFDGLAEGQMRDLRDVAGLRRINDLKTGALFVAALRGGALLGGARGEALERMTDFGRAIGFAFQLCDDLLDVNATAAEVGKDVGKDGRMLTFVDVWGEGRVRAAVRQSLNKAAEAAGPDGPMTRYVIDLFRHAGAV